MGLTRFIVGFTVCHKVLSCFTEFFRVLLGTTGLYWVLLGFIGFYRHLPIWTAYGRLFSFSGLEGRMGGGSLIDQITGSLPTASTSCN